MSTSQKTFLGLAMIFAWIFSGFDPVSLRLQRTLSMALPFDFNASTIQRGLLGDSTRLRLVKLDGELQFKEAGDSGYRSARLGETFSGNVALRTLNGASADFKINGATFSSLKLDETSYLVLKENRGPGPGLEIRILGGSFTLERAPQSAKQALAVSLLDTWNGRSFLAGNKSTYRIAVIQRPEFFASLNNGEIPDSLRSGYASPESFSMSDQALNQAVDSLKSKPAESVKAEPTKSETPALTTTTVVTPVPAAIAAPIPASAPKIVEKEKVRPGKEIAAKESKERAKKKARKDRDSDFAKTVSVKAQPVARLETEKPKATLETKRQETVAPRAKAVATQEKSDHGDEMRAAATIQRSNASTSSTETLFNSSLEHSLNDLLSGKLKAGDCQGAQDLLVNSKAGFQGDPLYDGWQKRWQGRIKKAKCSN